MATRPELREIATTRDGRDITRGYVDGLALLPPTDSVLIARGAGDYRIYDEVLRDDQVAATFAQRRLAVVSREWEVVPGGPRRQDRRAADFLRAQLQAIEWDRVTDQMLYGIYYGYAVAECLWSRDGQQVVLDALRVRDRRRFGFTPNGELRLITSERPDGEPVPERKFWHFSAGASHADEPYGLGLAHWLYWPVLFKRGGVQFWTIFLEKFGQPTAIGRFPAESTATERQRLLDALGAIQTDSGIILPESMQIELLEAARSGTADYATLYRAMNEAIAKVVLGQTMTTEDGSSRAQAQVHWEVRKDLVKADADLVCASFNRSVARWLTEWNFPGAAPPQVWRILEDAPDLDAQAERDLKLFQMGYRPTPEYVRGQYGEGYAPVPEAPDATEGPAPAFGEGDACCGFGEARGEHPIAAIADRMARDARPAMEEWLAEIEAMLEAAESLEQFREMLLAAYGDLPEERMAQVMAAGIGVAEAAGRFDIENAG